MGTGRRGSAARRPRTVGTGVRSARGPPVVLVRSHLGRGDNDRLPESSDAVGSPGGRRGRRLPGGGNGKRGRGDPVGLGVVRLREQPQLPLALDAEFRIRESTLHLDRLGLRSDLLEVDLDGSLDLARASRASSGSAPAAMPARSAAPCLASRRSRRGGSVDALRRDRGVRGGRVRAGREFALPGSRLYGVPLRDWKALVHWDPGRLEVSAAEGFVSGARPPCTCFRCSRPRKTRRRSR